MHQRPSARCCISSTGTAMVPNPNIGSDGREVVVEIERNEARSAFRPRCYLQAEAVGDGGCLRHLSHLKTSHSVWDGGSSRAHAV